MKTQNSKSSSTSGSSTAKTSGISGKNVSLNAENKITEEGARLDAKDTLSLSATTLDSRAAADKTWSSDSSKTDTERVGLYADANASAHAGGVEGTNASASVSAGIKAQYQTENSSNSSSTSTAVTSTYGGKNVVLNVKDKATLEGTKINATENVDITAGSLDYKAAKNTSTSSSSSDNKNIEAKLGVGAGASASAGGGAEAGYGGTIKGKAGLDGSDSGSSSSTSNVGSISGTNINIKTTKGDVNMEGTNLKSTGNTTVDAKGNLNYTAARDTSSSNNSSYNGEIKGELATYNQELSGKGGYNQNNSSSDKAVTGSINTGGNLTLKSGGSTTLEGTQLNSKGDTTIDAKGSVNLKQATSTTSGNGFNVEGEGKIGADGGYVKADGGYNNSSSSTAQTANINSSGNIKITSGQSTNIQGSDINAGKKVDISAGGGLNVTAKEESSSNFNVSGGVGFGNGGAQVDANLGGEKTTTKTGANISGAGGVNLSSGAAGTTLEGTQVKSSGGNVTVTSEGGITQKNANSSTVGGSVGVTFGSATNPGLTDLDLNLDAKSQKTNIAAGGGGTVTVQSNTKSGTAIAQKNGTSVPDPKKPEDAKKSEEPKKSDKK
jgi:hypothetical protein